MDQEIIKMLMIGIAFYPVAFFAGYGISAWLHDIKKERSLNKQLKELEGKLND